MFGDKERQYRRLHAFIRVMLYDEAQADAEAAKKKRAAEMLAAGQSEREVVEWLRKQGGLSQFDISQIVGIPLKDFVDGQY